jgi:zinc transporter 12
MNFFETIKFLKNNQGDYGLLRSSGFKNWQIILLNSIGSFAGFCSFLIISAIERNTGAKEWIFSITAGLFLYISLAGMVRKVLI